MRQVPFGGAGRVLAVAVAALVAFALGQFSIFGFEFLLHWQLSLRGWLPGFLLLSAAWGTAIQYVIWARATAGTPGPTGTMRGTALWLGALLALLLCAGWLIRDAYHCTLIAMPAIGLAVFGVILLGEVQVIRRLRAAGRDRAAFLALLAFEIVMMFSNGEGMAVDHFRKGLAHFEKDHAAIWSITSSGNVDFVVDYGRKDYVLSTRPGMGGAPFELRRSFVGRVCK